MYIDISFILFLLLTQSATLCVQIAPLSLRATNENIVNQSDSLLLFAFGGCSVRDARPPSKSWINSHVRRRRIIKRSPHRPPVLFATPKSSNGIFVVHAL